jgi:hypothetical protein
MVSVLFTFTEPRLGYRKNATPAFWVLVSVPCCRLERLIFVHDRGIPQRISEHMITWILTSLFAADCIDWVCQRALTGCLIGLVWVSWAHPVSPWDQPGGLHTVYWLELPGNP